MALRDVRPRRAYNRRRILQCSNERLRPDHILPMTTAAAPDGSGRRSPARRQRTPRPASGRLRSAASASSTATSARARSTRSARLIAAAAPAIRRPTPAVLGVLSLILWALIVDRHAQIRLILLRADNNGEGGTLALMALAQRALAQGGAAIVLLGIIGAALFYGDAVLTPALSVLSAVEGLKIVDPGLRALRRAAHGRDPDRAVRGAVARHREGRRLLRAVTLVWFVAIARRRALAYRRTIPTVLAAFNPALWRQFLPATA